jgi:hypothetical protein
VKKITEMNIVLEHYAKLKEQHENLKKKYEELKDRNPYQLKKRKRLEHFSASLEQQRKNKKMMIEKLDFMNDNLNQYGI